METKAEVIADSIDQYNNRITTMQLEYQRFIHSEFMTHRVFSRNAASSRAIPVEKQLEQVRHDPAHPFYWGLNQAGMQADNEAQADTILGAKDQWKYAAEEMSYRAKVLHDMGLHKQIVNRLLEPWQIMKVVVTATEWDNFFMLRISEYAQPEIKVLAEKMRDAMETSQPRYIRQDDWHLPYIQPAEYTYNSNATLRSISAARCARVSYLNHDQSSPDQKKDLALAKTLHEALHMSPFEHQATPIYNPHAEGVTHHHTSGQPWSGNFRGWIQYRQLL